MFVRFWYSIGHLGFWVALCLGVLLTGCSSFQPKNMNNLCELFDEKSSWYRSAKRAQKKWGTQASTLMAFIHQESRFQSRAKPPRKKILGIIPWFRPSSAYGFAQATDAAWKDYKDNTGRIFVSRSNMKDALDFVGWYNHRSYRRLGIDKNNAYALYLAYHEGHSGYQRGTYRKKPQVQRVAKKVARRASQYQHQYNGC